jgi:imidazolonepropionase-like amidohydrolase
MKAMVEAGLSLENVLAAATINNAKQFKIDNDYGTVEVGKIANLLLLKANPLSSIESWNSIDMIILRGNPIHREELAVNQ